MHTTYQIYLFKNSKQWLKNGSKDYKEILSKFWPDLTFLYTVENRLLSAYLPIENAEAAIESRHPNFFKR
jgi:hypothetical protein